MRVTYRPAPHVPADWLATASPKSTAADSGVPVPPFDEDEVTMAVEICHLLLERAKVEPASVTSLLVGSRTRSGLAPTIAKALGIEAAIAKDLPALHDALLGQPAALALHVQTDAPRPGRVPPGGPGPGAIAVARIEGPTVAPGRDIDLTSPPHPVTMETCDRLAKWEREAPLRTPMGAHIPTGTWERHAPARYRLEGSKCREGHVVFPPRASCPRCRTPSNPIALPREGTIESFTIVAKGAGPSEFEPLQDVSGEYAVGVADFGGARVSLMFVETLPDAIRIGLPVTPVFRRLYATEGAWRYGLKLRPIAQTQSP